MSILKVRDKNGNVVDIPAIRGKSAYEYAKDGGYTGTEAEFAEKMANSTDKRKISLGIASDELIYIFVDGVPVGDGVPQGQSGDVFGYVDENNTVVLTGNLVDGTYAVKYEMDNGTVVNIGNMVLDSKIYYSVTSTLTNCSISNNTKTVVEGGIYSATITANNGYNLKSVTVTMGGSAVSVSGGIINIASVTGNIVINAVAEQSGPTNLLPLSVDTDGSDYVGTHAKGGDGYEYGWRVNSSGQLVQFDGLYVTGFMPVTLNDTIRIKNITEYTADKSKNRIQFFNSAKGNVNGTTLLAENTIITVSNGVYTLKPSAVGGNGIAFFRFCCGGITDKTIVTVNEEIT